MKVIVKLTIVWRGTCFATLSTRQKLNYFNRKIIEDNLCKTNSTWRPNIKLETWIIPNDSWQFWYVKSRETLCAFWQPNVSTKSIGYPIYAEFANPIHQTFWFEFLGDFRLQPRRCRTWRHWSSTAGRKSSSQGHFFILSLSNFSSPNLRQMKIWKIFDVLAKEI